MNAPVFVDTNVLLYRHDKFKPEKQQAAETWLAHLWQTRSGRVSTQVLQEFYLNATQKLKPGLDRKAARQEVMDLSVWHPIPVDFQVIAEAWDLQDRYQLSFWDSLIAAAARLAGCRFLLTEDLQHDQDLNGVRVLSPFIARPSSFP
ncbi:MAG TPA: PIN domain-containing protein [Thermoanaerobaculia bacterium]|jgi:predicted nucleic acid-binding protein